MKRYICKKDESRDCYKEAVLEILGKSLALIDDNKHYREFFLDIWN